MLVKKDGVNEVWSSGRMSEFKWLSDCKLLNYALYCPCSTLLLRH